MKTSDTEMNPPENVADPSLSSRGTADTPATDRVTQAAHRVVDDAAAKLESAERQVREQMEHARGRARQNRDQAQEWVDERTSKLQQTIKQNPLTSLAIAFTAGLVLSRLLKRD